MTQFIELLAQALTRSAHRHHGFAGSRPVAKPEAMAIAGTPIMRCMNSAPPAVAMSFDRIFGSKYQHTIAAMSVQAARVHAAKVAPKAGPTITTHSVPTSS